jgi:hypothetical protein
VSADITVRWAGRSGAADALGLKPEGVNVGAAFGGKDQRGPAVDVPKSAAGGVGDDVSSDEASVTK